MEILGRPSAAELLAMNPDYGGDKCLFNAPPKPWSSIFGAGTPPEAVRFVATLLVYKPTSRPAPLDCLLDPYFDELRQESTRLPDGKALPPHLFNFTEVEHWKFKENNIAQLIPKWYHGAQRGRTLEATKALDLDGAEEAKRCMFR